MADKANFEFPSGDVIRNIIEAIDEHTENMASKRGEYMAFCKDERESIKSLYDDAKDKGIPKRALRAAIKRRDLRNKIENERIALDDTEMQDDMVRVEAAILAFETTPLGRAASKTAAA